MVDKKKEKKSKTDGKNTFATHRYVGDRGTTIKVWASVENYVNITDIMWWMKICVMWMLSHIYESKFASSTSCPIKHSKSKIHSKSSKLQHFQDGWSMPLKVWLNAPNDRCNRFKVPIFHTSAKIPLSPITHLGYFFTHLPQDTVFWGWVKK